MAVSAVILAARLFFCETTKTRVIACFLMPLVASLVSTLVYCLFSFLAGAPDYAYNGYAVCLFVLPMSFVWSYVAIPAGIILAFFAAIVEAAVTSYKINKADQKNRD